MIKLLYEFDKTIEMHLSGKDARHFIRELIIDDVSNIDIYQAICPICSGQAVTWKYCRTRIQHFIWDSPDDPVSVELPQYSFHCRRCSAKNLELITTDITIDKTNLSYHYLFHLLRIRLLKSRRIVSNQYELDNMLYGLLCEESLKNWVRRFHSDYRKLSFLMQIDLADLLYERKKMGDAFQQFFLTENRFFLSESSPKMLIFPDERGALQWIRYEATNGRKW